MCKPIFAAAALVLLVAFGYAYAQTHGYVEQDAQEPATFITTNI